MMASPATKERDLILRIIRNELAPVNHKCYAVSIQLGIPHYRVKEFQREEDPLTMAVDYWLNGNADPAIPISWKSIVKALKTDSVDEPGLAKKISQMYCPQTEEESPELAGHSLPNSEDEEEKLDSDIETDLEIVLEQNIDDIMTKYAAYVDCIRGIIQDKKIPPEELLSYLMTLAAFSQSYKGQKLALLSDKKAELEKKDTITGIFTFLITECSSFLNYGLFQKIVKKYKITEDREELQYHEHLKAYIKQHKVSEFTTINPQLKKYEKDSEKVTFKFDIENICSLAKIDKLKKAIAKIMKINSIALQIVDIKKGCIAVTVLITASVANSIFSCDPVFTSQQEDEFRSLSVLWLDYKGRVFTFNDERKEEGGCTIAQTLKDQLTCSICHDKYEDPKVLQCHHAYCKKCLEKLVQQENLVCPSCHQVTPVPANGVGGLQSDFRINQLLELKDEDFNEFTAASLDKVEFASSEVVSTTQKSIVLFCSEHAGREIELFCETCKEAICYKCIKKGGKHNSHDYEEVDDIVERYVSKEIPSSLEITEEALTQLDKCREEISNQREAIEADIHNTRLPDMKKTDLISELHQLTQVKVKNLAAQKDEIEIFQTQLNRHFNSMREGLKIGNLHKKVTALKQVKEVISKLQPDVLTPIAEADMAFLTGTGGSDDGQVLTSSSPDPSNCYATRIGLAVVGERSTAIVHLQSYSNHPCQEQMMDYITIEFVSDITGAKGTGIVERRGVNKYELSYEPSTVGMHQLHIKVLDQHIKGSPFLVKAKAPVKTLGTPILTINDVSQPYGIAVNQVGEIVVSEYSKNCVSVFSLEGKRLRSFGGSNLDESRTEEGLLNGPDGVAVDNEGNILIANIKTHRVQKFTAQGKLLLEVGSQGYSGPLQFEKPCPCGIAVEASSGKIYVGSRNHAITILNPDFGYCGKLGTGFGQNVEQFRHPHHIAFDSEKNIYVADSGNNRIQVFSTEGNFLRTIGQQGERQRDLNYPYGIAIDSSDRVFVSEMDNNRISIFTRYGKFVTSFGSEGNGPGQFFFPKGLAIDSSDILYVCDSSNERIQLFRSFK